MEMSLKCVCSSDHPDIFGEESDVDFLVAIRDGIGIAAGISGTS